MVALFPEGSDDRVRQSASENVSEGHDSGVVHQYSEVVSILEEALVNARAKNGQRLREVVLQLLRTLWV